MNLCFLRSLCSLCWGWMLCEQFCGIVVALWVESCYKNFLLCLIFYVVLWVGLSCFGWLCLYNISPLLPKTVNFIKQYVFDLFQYNVLWYTYILSKITIYTYSLKLHYPKHKSTKWQTIISFVGKGVNWHMAFLIKQSISNQV